MIDIPKTQKIDIGYRSISSSDTLNTMTGDILEDILTLTARANDMEKHIIELKEISEIENSYIMAAYPKGIGNTLSYDVSNATVLLNASSFYTDATSAAFVDSETSDVTLTTLYEVSRTSLYDEVFDKTFLPDTLKVFAYPMEDDVNIIDNNVLNPFKDSNDYYVRRVIDNTASEVYLTYEIVLPEDSISTKDINCITVKPYPYKNVDIVNIEYMYQGSYQQVPSFSGHSESTLENYVENNVSKTRNVIKNAPNIKFNFQKVTADRIRITLRQRTSITYNGKRTFCLGLKDIKIKYNEYSSDALSFNTEIVLDPSKTVTIHKIDTVFNNKTELAGNEISYDFYYINSSNAKIKITNSFPFSVTGSKLIIKGNIHKNSVTPNIAKLMLTYSA